MKKSNTRKNILKSRKIKYRSSLEENQAKILKDNAADFRYESQKLEYVIPESAHTYTPDFIVRKKTGGYIYLECKGGGPLYGLTDKVKIKMRCIKSQYPELDIRFIFENEGLKTGIGKGYKMSNYAGWADFYGFPHANKRIPIDWLKEMV